MVRAISVYVSNEAPFSSDTTVSWVWLESAWPKGGAIINYSRHVVKRVLERKDAVAG